MNTFDRLSAIRDLSVLGMEHSTIASKMLDSIAKLADAGRSDDASGRVPSETELVHHFGNPSIAELHDYQTMGKIAAIKAYRDRTSVCLKDAKDRIELAAEALGLMKPQKHTLATENEDLRKLVTHLLGIIDGGGRGLTDDEFDSVAEARRHMSATIRCL